MTVESTSGEVGYDELATGNGAEKIAADLIRLLFNSANWINRRVDSLEFPDDLTLTRSVGIDLTIPDDSPMVRMGGTTAVLLPIGRVRKTPMAQFHFRDETGRALPLLPRNLVKNISFAMLVKWLEIQCDVDINLVTPEERQELIERLDTVVEVAFRPDASEDGEETTRVKNAIDALTKEGDDTLGPLKEVAPQRRKAFGVLVKMLAREHLILALLENVSKGQEKIIEYAYDRPLLLYSKRNGDKYSRSRRKSRQIRDDLRLRKIFEFPAMNMAYARSYHWQFLLPEGVAWHAAGLYDMTAGLRDPSSQEDRQNDNQRLVVPEGRRDPGDPVYIRMASRVDLHATTREESRVSDRFARWSTLGRAKLSLVPSRGTWVGASLAIACMSTLVIASVAAALFGGLWSGQGYPSGILSLVLLFVTVAFPPVLRPETGFAKRILAGARLAAFSGALPPLLLAVTMNLTHPGALSGGIAAALLALAALLAWYLYMVWHRANLAEMARNMSAELDEHAKVAKFSQYPVNNAKGSEYYEQFDIAEAGPTGVAPEIEAGVEKLSMSPQPKAREGLRRRFPPRSCRW